MFLGEKIKRKKIAFVHFVHLQNIEIVGFFSIMLPQLHVY